MYEVVADPYCYPGSTILRNRLGLRDQTALDAFEADAVTLRAEQPLPSGRFTPAHYRAVHRHLFQDVYPWAGRFRTIRIAKGGSMFCYPEHIAGQLARLLGTLRSEGLLQGLSRDPFAARSAHFLAELNAIHAFREGNGRAQLVFFAALAENADRRIDFARMDPERFLRVMIESFQGDESVLASEIRLLI